MKFTGHLFAVSVSILTLISACSSSNINQTDTGTKRLIFQQNFENANSGPLSDEIAKTVMPRLKWSQFYERGAIFNDKFDGSAQAIVLRILYPAGGVGPSESGAQFELPIPAANEYTLSYKVYFEEGFEWVLGGKLPGLTSGGPKYTGGTHPTQGQGWSARFMWREDGEAVVYLYSVDNKKPWGDDIALNTHFKTGKWYEITQRIALNDPFEKNAVMQVWINGEQVLNKQNFRLRIGEQGYIDTLFFSSFFGGNQPNWAPSQDVYARFDDFLVY